MTWAETGEIIEQKKWLINRFEAAMDVNKEELITMRETFNSYINRIDIGLKEGRTITLTAVALIASVVLGIAYEQIKISYSYIIGIILSIIIVEMVVFVVLSIFRQRAYSIIRQVDLAFFFAIDKMNIVEGVHMINTVNLQKIEIDRLEFFVDYSRFAAMVVRLPLLDAYTSVYNSLLFRSLRPQVNVGIEFHHILMNSAKDFYENHELEFHRFGSDFLAMNSTHDTFLKRYNITYPNPQIHNTRTT